MHASWLARVRSLLDARLIGSLFAAVYSACSFAAAITVTSTGDTIAVDDTVTLREAIASVNMGANINVDVVAVGAYGSDDTINFNISGTGVQTITPASGLPTIAQPVTIDGYSQPGSAPNTNGAGPGTNAVLRIELNLSGTGSSGGLAVAANGSLVRGLVINRAAPGTIAILLAGDSNTVAGNFIGTDAAPTTAGPGNGGDGIAVMGSNNTIGGVAVANRNLISANGVGIRVNGTNNSIAGNLIGTNAGAGILVGGAGPAGGTGNRIRANSIYLNGGLGIDLDTQSGAPTPNDAGDLDIGANRLQNFPVITAAFAGAGAIAVSGTLNSTPNSTFDIDLFQNGQCDPSGHGEGIVPAPNPITVTTDASGNAAFGPSVLAPVFLLGPTFITATATNAATGDTSEFSACFAAHGGLPTLSIDDVTRAEGSAGTTNFVFTVAISQSANATVVVTRTDGTATSGTDYPFEATPAVVTFTAGGPLTATVTYAVNGDASVEPDETFVVNLSSAVGAFIVDAQGIGTIVNDDGAPPVPADIPTLGEWQLIALALLLVVMAWHETRRLWPHPFSTCRTRARSCGRASPQRPSPSRAAPGGTSDR